MPLVIPALNSDGTDQKTQEWHRKLEGKKLSETESNETTFCISDLPKDHRIIRPGTLVTKDYRENRLNVHVKDDGTVSHVLHG